jgi:arsenate reductase
MAEAFLRHYAADRFEAVSAGLDPREVHPLTRQVLEEIDIEAGDMKSKPVSSVLGRFVFRHAIILCAETQENCPRLYPFALKTHYWPFDDPSDRGESEEQQMAAFRRVRDEIAARIRAWLKEPGTTG